MAIKSRFQYSAAAVKGIIQSFSATYQNSSEIHFSLFLFLLLLNFIALTVGNL